MIENLKIEIQEIEDNLILKSDYTEELKQLELIESDILTLARLGIPHWKCKDLMDKVNFICEWIRQETN